MSWDICTYCGREGHRAHRCPARLRYFVGCLVWRWRRVVCAVLSCRMSYRGYNLVGRHDEVPHGVYECARCGRVRLGVPG